MVSEWPWGQKLGLLWFFGGILAAIVVGAATGGSAASILVVVGTTTLCAMAAHTLGATPLAAVVTGGVIGGGWAAVAFVSASQGRVITLIVCAVLIASAAYNYTQREEAARETRIATSVVALALLLFGVAISYRSMRGYEGNLPDLIENADAYEQAAIALNQHDWKPAVSDVVDTKDSARYENREGAMARLSDSILGKPEPSLVTSVRVICHLEGDVSNLRRLQLLDALAAARLSDFYVGLPQPQDYVADVSCGDVETLPYARQEL